MTKRTRPNFTAEFRLACAQLVVDKIVVDKNLRFEKIEIDVDLISLSGKK